VEFAGTPLKLAHDSERATVQFHARRVNAFSPAHLRIRHAWERYRFENQLLRSVMTKQPSFLAIGWWEKFHCSARGLPCAGGAASTSPDLNLSFLSANSTPSAISRELQLVSPNDQARWFAEEVQPHEPGLRNWLRHRFPRLTDIDDLVQECFARVLRARSEGRVESAKPYLFSTARNAVYDQARRHRVVCIESVEDVAMLSVVEDRPDAAEALTHDQDLEILAAAIEALPERCRLVVKLRKLRGLSYQEIARTLGISVHTVNAQLAKGMTLCRDYFREHGGEAR
jgi:RNA polymerase sigma-70 factor (ECF subfamily)